MCCASRGQFVAVVVLALLSGTRYSSSFYTRPTGPIAMRAFSNFAAPLRARRSLSLPLPFSLLLLLLSLSRLLSVKLWRPFRNMCVLCLTHKASTSAACHAKARARGENREREREGKRERERERESALGGEFRAAPFRQSSASPVQLQPTQSVG